MKNNKKDRDKFMNREKKKKNAEKKNKRVKLSGSKTSLEVVINIINKIKKMLKKKSKD
jgi:Zn-dependent M28 family amino/carboxypeptidase